jgi:hypothetical protein
VHGLNDGPTEIDMGFFTQREHPEPNRRTVIEGKSREFAGQSYNSPRRAPAHDAPPRDEPPQNYAPRWRAEKDRVDGNADRLREQMTVNAIKQIDRLLVELQAHRQRLLNEAARVQQDLVDYAALSQSTMQSTKIINESLTHWNRIRNAPGMAEEHDRASTGAFMQTGDASSLTAAQPETPGGTESASAEALEASNSPECPDHTGPETNEADGAIGAIHEAIEGDRASAPHLSHSLPRVTLLPPCADRSTD